MKRKQVNPYDAHFDSMHQALREVKGLDQLLTAPGAMRYTEFTAVQLYEMSGLAALYNHVIIPAINRNNVVQRDHWKQSRASKVVQLNAGHFREDKFTVIRLAYVQLFHRYESFINELFPLCEQIVEDPGYAPGALYNYIKTEFKLDFKRPSYHQTLKEVNYVANCVKHTNVHPKRTPVPERFRELDPALPIRIPEKELHRDFIAIRDLMGQVVVDVARASQILLYRSRPSIIDSGPFNELTMFAIGRMETLLKREFDKYKVNFVEPSAVLRPGATGSN